MTRAFGHTSSDYRRPYRPLPVRAFNALGRGLQAIGRFPGELDAAALMRSAARKTGLDDFGDPWFRRPLVVLIDSINAEARLTPTGFLIQKMRLVEALCTRLRVEDLLKRHPEIAEIDLGDLIVIAGLQRSGTTTLHRLLAADPDTRSLASWEALNPLPVPGEQAGNPAARLKQAKRAERGLAYLAPDFFAIHPVEFDAPEEDVLLLDLCFMSQAPEAVLHVPAYAKWLESQDHAPAYRYLRTLLKILHWQRPARRWVIKTPHHMEHLDVIGSTFPHAKVVQTHRDPLKTSASFFSMVAHGRGVFSDHVDPVGSANHWLRKVERMIESSISVRGGTDSTLQFIDVSYYDLLERPLEVVKDIYQAADIPLDSGVLRAMEETGRRNVQYRYGKHVYDLESFGLTEDEIDMRFAFYRENYNIPVERDA